MTNATPASEPSAIRPDSSESALNPVRTDLRENGVVEPRPRSVADVQRTAISSKIFDLISSGEWVLPVQSVETTAGNSILLTFEDGSRSLINVASLAPGADLAKELEDAWAGDDARDSES